MRERKPFLDAKHPMFSKTWVRVLTTALPLAWGGFEFWNGEPMWGLMFGAAGLYAGWKLFIDKT